MEELLVSLACLSGKGCTETWNQYYDSKPDIRQIVLTVEHRAKAMAGPIFWNYGAPIVFLASGHDGSLNLSPHFSLQYGRKDFQFIFKKEF